MPEAVLPVVPPDDLWLQRLPDSECAFTLCQVALVVGVPYDTVHRAQLALSYRASTREVMRPLDKETPRHYSPLAARLIARHVSAPTARELRAREADRDLMEAATPLLSGAQRASRASRVSHGSGDQTKRE